MIGENDAGSSSVVAAYVAATLRSRGEGVVAHAPVIPPVLLLLPETPRVMCVPMVACPFLRPFVHFTILKHKGW